MEQDGPLLEIKDITKSFAGVYALRSVSFEVNPGEVLAICGENGAGKSTLMKILSGGYAPDSGTITAGGDTYESLTPVQARELGINIIHQENLLVPTMSVLENIFIGHEVPTAGVFMNYSRMRQQFREECEFLDITLNPNTRVEHVSVAEQQFVKILKALMLRPRVLIMDEPTSMFNAEDSARVLRMVNRISSVGIAVVYISHFLQEVQKIADRVIVLRDGELISTRRNSGHDIDLDDITRDMVGRPVEMFYQRAHHPVGEVHLEVQGFRVSPESEAVDLHVRRGEILGIAGMVGSGRTELVRAIAGADRFAAGRVSIDGRQIRLRGPRDAIRAGIAHITEDRQALGLALGLPVVENASVVALDELTSGPLMRVSATAGKVRPVLERLRTRMASLFQEVRRLSGGNQQKVVLAKWLLADCEIFIFDEPTRGIDVNAKAEFYAEMVELCRRGRSIIMVSSDMPELISLSDRVLVMRSHQIVAELGENEITEERIITHALEGRYT